MSRPVTVTVAQLTQILASLDRPQPIGFISLTDAKARKTDNPWGQVMKLSKVNAFTSTDYEGAVQKQQVREGQIPTFQSSARSWGTKVAPSLLAHPDKKGKEHHYLIAQVQRATKPLYLIRKPKGRHGQILTAVAKNVIESVLPAPRSGGAQPVEKNVIWRTYRLDSIVSLSIGGRKYRIRHADQP